MNNTNSTLGLDLPEEMTEAANRTQGFSMYPAQILIDKYVTICVLLIGVPGNVLSFIIWMQKRMRHSSGYYLAALAINDLIFLVMVMIFEVHTIWGTANLLSYPLVCQLFPVIYLALQSLSPGLVLAFTTERYISICHPFKRDTFCTIHRAKLVVVCLAIGCLLLSAVNGYFFYLTTLNDAPDCDIRPSVLAGGRYSVFNVYKMATDALSFLLVPLAILLLNILVIREMRRLSRFEPTQSQGSPAQRTGSTTVMLLTVSFYQIITTLPISVVYAMMPDFSDSPTFLLILTSIKEYGVTHYAFNFIIYVITGRMFREELKRFLLQPFGSHKSNFSSEYNSLKTSVVFSARKCSSANGNHSFSEKTKSPEPSETLL
ncbi:hypothetical protein EGW08_005790 [Elysia chlorotica]|uniref:G-protein coupled receptors family 1 profile domain-containing protein n=1 Tax=Elysia chlorotica TaxID=188477 RepID=A0A3S1BEH1_ELYCH|nr:hypothetical protein EGW08_005790 [Elysia chlorotica]